MFGFLKDKLKKALSKFTKDVEEEVEEKAEEQPKEEKPKKEKPASKEEKKPSQKEEKKEKKPEKKEEEKKEEKEKKKPLPKEIPKKEEEKKAEKKPEIPSPKKEEKTPVKAHVTVSEIKKEKKEEKKEEKAHPQKEEKAATEKTGEKAEEKKGFFGKLKHAFSGEKQEPKEQLLEKPESEEKETPAIEAEKEEEKSKGFFEKLTEVVTKKTLSEEKFEELFFELEVAMLENNVAVEVIEKIKEDLKSTLLSEKVSRVKTEVAIAQALKKSVEELFDVPNIDILKEAKKKKPYIICFVGVNGSGKTTNLAKLANYLKKSGLSVVIAACDTFRAAAIQQIEDHANKLDVKLIKHDYGADAAAVAFDAIEHAKAKGKDVVLIDTAGRSHANVNLMEELEKVVRVSKPDLKIFVGDSLTGNDAVEQAKTFNEKIGVDGIILSKVDVDEKGGAAISVSYVTKKPILFIGTGQTYDDFERFSEDKVIGALGF